MNFCKKCKKQTNNPKYCSRSCASSVNNKTSPKRKKESLCSYCGKYIRSNPRSGVKKCKNCYLKECSINYGEKIIADFTSAYPRHKYQHIRNHAHTIAKLHELKKQCAKCGYDKIVHLCHKKPISSFSPNTKLNIINDLSNLVYLCPNHHWEFDHGFLILD